MIGLPSHIRAALFDLDGVLTGTAALHREAWRATFDDFLKRRDPAHFVGFTDRDYAEYVDGRPRADGVREFLNSRGIVLPEGSPDDPPTAETVPGVGNRKNDLVRRIIEERGVNPYPGSVRYVRALHDAGVPLGVVTSSANGTAVLAAADLMKYIQVLIDGQFLAREGLLGKPAPDSFLAGAKALGIPPAETAVFEDALAGVAAGRAGGFGYVVGVNRADQAGALREHGADVVVDDLAELLEKPA